MVRRLCRVTTRTTHHHTNHANTLSPTARCPPSVTHRPPTPIPTAAAWPHHHHANHFPGRPSPVAHQPANTNGGDGVGNSNHSGGVATSQPAPPTTTPNHAISPQRQ